MGAGSAKGRPLHHDDNQDGLSGTSSDKWGNNSEDESLGDNDRPNSDPQETHESPSLDPGPSAQINGSTTEMNAGTEDATHDDKMKAEQKRRFGFKFNKRHNNNNEEHDKPVEFEEDPQEEADKKKKGDKKESKKDGDKKTGFKLFGWRNKKEEPDAQLDDDIDQLEKTFDSLGIVGKNMWGDDDKPPLPRKEAADDLELLEPMRKRKNVRVRGTRGMNGTIASANHDPNAGKNSNASSGSRRTFRYSWETEKKKTKPDDEDEWEYKAVVIEGFDIDKFRKANKKDNVFDSTSLPNAVSDEYEDGKPVLRYDQNEQQILASIERDFTFN
ncbi:protein starmaker-like isoform X2 [Palaemon carinicauda]|uniref:protein starmaker-like isoform X2 n=1 Tax=Palaemon carinicauda TaxID=392227 RepID=UPI0035B6054C